MSVEYIYLLNNLNHDHCQTFTTINPHLRIDFSALRCVRSLDDVFTLALEPLMNETVQQRSAVVAKRRRRVRVHLEVVFSSCVLRAHMPKPIISFRYLESQDTSKSAGMPGKDSRRRLSKALTFYTHAVKLNVSNKYDMAFAIVLGSIGYPETFGKGHAYESGVRSPQCSD